MRPRLYALALLLASCAAPPPPPPDSRFREIVDAAVQPFLASGEHVGLAVGVVHHRRRHVFGYGRISAAVPTPPDGDTVFEIGSITKAFTATLLLQEGTALHDPIRRHLPADLKVPTRDGKEITLLHLATHHSGLPRLPTNFDPKDLANPYADYGAEDLYDCLETVELDRAPGATYEYSNLGAGLLGHLLERRNGKSYEQLVLTRICEPLGMSDTRITLSAEQRRRLAPGHLSPRKPAANWDPGVLSGMYALRSTANDMLRFLDANLGGAYDAAHSARAPIGDGMSIGLGWHLLPLSPEGPMVVWHNGGTGGYRSFAAFIRKTGTAVVVLGNSTADTDAIGITLLRLLQGVR